MVCYISPERSNKLTWLPFQKIQPKGSPSFQDREETTTPPEKKNSNMGHGGSKYLQKTSPSAISTL